MPPSIDRSRKHEHPSYHQPPVSRIRVSYSTFGCGACCLLWFVATVVISATLGSIGRFGTGSCHGERAQERIVPYDSNVHDVTAYVHITSDGKQLPNPLFSDAAVTDCMRAFLHELGSNRRMLQTPLTAAVPSKDDWAVCLEHFGCSGRIKTNDSIMFLVDLPCSCPAVAAQSTQQTTSASTKTHAIVSSSAASLKCRFAPTESDYAQIIHSQWYANVIVSCRTSDIEECKCGCSEIPCRADCWTFSSVSYCESLTSSTACTSNSWNVPCAWS